MANFDKTMKFNYDELPKDNVETVLNNVYNTLEERGYNAVNQIVGYLLSGDPRTFLVITKHATKLDISIEMILWKS